MRKIFKIEPGFWHVYVDDLNQIIIEQLNSSFLDIPASCKYVGFFSIKPNVEDVENILRAIKL